MNRNLRNVVSRDLASRNIAQWILVVFASCGALASDYARGQGTGYQSPNFTQLAQQARRSSPYPTSPLAGGRAAAQGDAFMDASGKPIIMPASYCQSCPPGSYGQGSPGGYGGDPMAVDFGGYGQDQSGPHYFDFAIESVFLQQDLAGEGLPAFTSFGIGFAAGQTINPFLDPSGQGDNYEAGWRAIARLDLGPLSVLEATYMGSYNLGFNQSVTSADVNPALPNQLFTIFSNFGFIDPDGGDGITGIPGLDEASVHRFEYDSDLQTTEFSLRRYWVGNNPRVSGTWLAGFRYTRMTEDFIFSATTQDGNGVLGTFTENDLVGFQIGGDGWLTLRQGLRVGVTGKTGVYNNRYKFNTTVANIGTATINPQPDAEGNQIAFIADAGVSFVADIWSSWSIKGGYEVLYLNSLVTVRENVNTDLFNPAVAGPPALGTQDHALYHGFHGGVEYIW